jgi:hypothetical protein
LWSIFAGYLDDEAPSSLLSSHNSSNIVQNDMMITDIQTSSSSRWGNGAADSTPRSPLRQATQSSSTSINKAEATRFILRQAKEREAALGNADCEIEVLKELIMEQGKGSNGQSFTRMERIQWLDTECSKAIQDINALSDLVQELWSEEDFEPDVDYMEKAKQIVDRPASRRGLRVARRRSSYKEMKILFENIAV